MFLVPAARDRLSGPGPEEVLEKYLDADLKRRYQEAYGYVSSADKSAKSLDEYSAENKERNTPLAQALISRVAYDVLSVSKADGKATAKVEVTSPDFGIIVKDVMGMALASAFGSGGEKDAKDLEEELAQKYQNDDLPVVKQKKEYQLIKEKDGWKVFLDWEAEKEKLAKQAKIEELLAEAEELKKSRKLEGAVEKYQQVLELDNDLVKAKEAIESTKKEIESFAEKQDYVKKVTLYDLEAGYYDTFLEGRIPGVKFKLKNTGDRTLNEVEVTVYFKDASGTVIAEKAYHPVLVSEYSFLGNNNPLKPNYIWQMEGDQFYKAESVPTEWKEGAASAKITNIEFAD